MRQETEGPTPYMIDPSDPLQPVLLLIDLCNGSSLAVIEGNKPSTQSGGRLGLDDRTQLLHRPQTGAKKSVCPLSR